MDSTQRLNDDECRTKLIGGEQLLVCPSGVEANVRPRANYPTRSRSIGCIHRLRGFLCTSLYRSDGPYQLHVFRVVAFKCNGEEEGRGGE